MSHMSILIVEDDKPVRDMLKDVLEIEGYKIVTAADGNEGLEILRTMSPLPCLIVLDLMMPGTNGWRFLDYQRQDAALSKIPVVVCSAYSESAKSVKPDGIVEKPVQLEHLLETVNAYCA